MSKQRKGTPSSSARQKKTAPMQNNAETRKRFTRISSPLFHWQDGNGEGFVIGGVSGFPAKTPPSEPDEKPVPETESNEDE